MTRTHSKLHFPFNRFWIWALHCIACGACASNDASERVEATPDFESLDVPILNGTSISGRAGLVEVPGPCTGTIIGPTLILTAAHCLLGKSAPFNANLRYFRPGRNPNEPIVWPTLQVRAVRHPDAPTSMSDFNTETDSDHDVALIVLDDPSHRSWPDTDYHDYVRVHHAGTIPDYLTMFARGPFSTGGSGSGTLRVGSFEVENVFALRLELDAGTFGTCKGDSGAPLMLTSQGHDLIACVTSLGENNHGVCTEDSLLLPDDFLCARTKTANAKNFIAESTDVECKHVATNGAHEYLRCFDLPYVSDVSDGDRLPKGLAVAVVSGLAP